MSTRFNADSHKALNGAQAAAKNLGHAHLLPEHLLIGLLHVKNTKPATLLLGYGLTEEKASARAQALLADATVATSAGFSDDLQRILKSASEVSLSRRSPEIDIDTLASALFAANMPGVDQILAPVGTSSSQLLAELNPTTAPAPANPAAARPAMAGPGHPATPPAAGKVLAQYTRDLTAAATAGTLDPVIGREQEIERLCVILTRRTKNNPVLIGEPGVGKTAVVEALAQQIVAGTAPKALRGKRLLALDLAGMVAGSRFRGDFEERVKAVVEEAHTSGDVILFLDEMHQLAGAGSSGASGGMDAAQMLKEALSRGGITLLGATTTEEYRHIEADPALERRFQPVRVEEPDAATTACILERLAPMYAEHHKVRYTSEAVTAAAGLAERYIRGRQNPDKAIDVLDEAGARAALTAAAERIVDGSPAAEAEARDVVVDAEQIAAVVSTIAGVPVTTLNDHETVHLAGLADRLGARVVGQPGPVQTVAKAVRRRRVGLEGGTRPSSFLFAGPTGVGKSELAKALADDLFGADASTGQGRLLQFDMSEFSEKHTVARLIGAPPGYTGHDAGGQLTEAVRRNPYSVVLLDEIEKAHTDVFDILLQILEDGRLTDGQGRVVDFRHTVVILTSNLGARDAAKTALGFGTGHGGRSPHDVVLAAVKATLRPELLNRLDDVVVFNSLTREDLTTIVHTLLDPVRQRLAERDITLEVTDAALTALLTDGNDTAMGARPLRRAITRQVTDAITDGLICGAIRPGDHVIADCIEGRIAVAAHADAPVMA